MVKLRRKIDEISQRVQSFTGLDVFEQLSKMSKAGFPLPEPKLIKTNDQIDGIRKASQLTHRILNELEMVIRPGVTTNYINDWVHDFTVANGAIPAPLHYRGFPKSICTSINEVVCHGIPEDRVLVDGDMINVDVTCILDGYYGDSCRMYMVGNVDDTGKRLSKVTKECLHRGLDQIKPFNTGNEVGAAIEEHAHAEGFTVVEIFGGHGVGLEFHEDPFIFHYPQKAKQMVFLPNMVFTVEPMINEGIVGVEILNDGWTAVTLDRKRSAQWEHTIAVTTTGYEILT